MKVSTRFEKAFNALTEAYFNGTLAKGNCRACAVGNMLLSISESHGVDAGAWSAVFVTLEDGRQMWGYNTYFDKEDGMRLIAHSDYEVQELAKIEFAFESNTRIHFVDYDKHSEQRVLEDQYNGLCAVIDVLMSFENVNKSDEYKNKMRHPKLITHA